MIETQRLVLRETDWDDSDAVSRLLNDLAKAGSSSGQVDDNQVKDWILKNKINYNLLGFGSWVVCLKETGEIIGDCGLTMIDICGIIRPNLSFNIRSDYRRMGYATEAAKAVCEWTFKATTFNVIYSWTDSENIPAVKTIQAYGGNKCDEFEAENRTIQIFGINRPE